MAGAAESTLERLRTAARDADTAFERQEQALAAEHRDQFLACAKRIELQIKLGC